MKPPLGQLVLPTLRGGRACQPKATGSGHCVPSAYTHAAHTQTQNITKNKHKHTHTHDKDFLTHIASVLLLSTHIEARKSLYNHAPIPPWAYHRNPIFLTFSSSLSQPQKQILRNRQKKYLLIDKVILRHTFEILSIGK